MTNNFLKPWNTKNIKNDTPFQREKYAITMITDYIEPHYIKYLKDNAFRNNSLFKNDYKDIKYKIDYDLIKLVMQPDSFNSITMSIMLPYHMEIPIYLVDQITYNFKFIIMPNKELASKSLKITRLYLDIYFNKNVNKNYYSIQFINCFNYNEDIKFKQFFDKFRDIYIPTLCDRFIEDCKIYLNIDISNRLSYDEDYFKGIVDDGREK